jgi:hypothetical protein
MGVVGGPCRWGCVVRDDGSMSAVGRFPLPYVRLPGAVGSDDEAEDDDD